jgi:hypothetical protein
MVLNILFSKFLEMTQEDKKTLKRMVASNPQN